MDEERFHITWLPAPLVCTPVNETNGGKRSAIKQIVLDQRGSPTEQQLSLCMAVWLFILSVEFINHMDLYYNVGSDISEI